MDASSSSSFLQSFSSVDIGDNDRVWGLAGHFSGVMRVACWVGLDVDLTDSDKRARAGILSSCSNL